MADSKELTRTSAIGIGRGLIKILFLHLSGGTKDIHAKPHSQWSECRSRFDLRTSGKSVELESA
jgi:hypothetical protein